MRNKIKSKYSIIKKLFIWVTIIITTFIMIFLDFSNATSRSIEEDVYENLTESVNQSINSFSIKIEEKLHTLKVIGSLIGELEEPSVEELISILETSTAQGGFTRISILNENGKGFTDDGKDLDVHSRDYFKSAISGRTTVSEVINTVLDGKEAIVLAVPIEKEKEVIGVLTGTIYLEDIEKVIDIKILGGTGYTNIIDQNGNIIAKSKNYNKAIEYSNHFEFFEKVTFEKGYDLGNMKENMSKNITGSTTFSYNGEENYISYVPIRMNNWYAVGTAPMEIVTTRANEMYKISLNFMAKVIFLLFLIFIYIFSKNKMEAEKIRISEERYKIITDQTEGVIFEHNFLDGSIKHSKKYKKVFGEEPLINNFPNSFVKKGIVHEADCNKLIENYRKSKRDGGTHNFEIRIRNCENEYLWCKVSTTTICDDFGKPFRLVGIIFDINEQKKKEVSLIRKAMRDPLTTVYNKGATELLISNYLLNSMNNNKMSAFMIIDIDNFKGINDTLGHATGDGVLVTVSRKIKNIFLKSAIIGRIGGDEFVVFIKEIHSKEDIDIKSQEVLNIFREAYVGEEEEVQLSGSIGVSIYPQNGVTFNELYKSADKALYSAKKQGKDRYSIV